MATERPRLMSNAPIAIIGAGLAGLACARALLRAGKRCTVFEAADRPGGRVRSDELDGFTLDRGFQVLLPSYSEARSVLDYEALDLQPFYRGAALHLQGRTHLMADPLYHPVDACSSVLGLPLALRDLWRCLLLTAETASVREVERRLPEMSTEHYLRAFGFSTSIIDRFFRPFFGGVFLEKDLRTSARMFLYLHQCFRRGGAAIPARGMQAIADQLAAGLPEGSVRCNEAVCALRPGELILASGEVIASPQIVLAVGEEVAHRLLPDLHGEKPKPGRSTTCLYFASRDPLPDSRPILHLDADNRGPVNHAVVLSAVSPKLAPPGWNLISTSIIGAPSSLELPDVVREQMSHWFGPCALEWQHLRTYQIRHAQPEGRQLALGDGPLHPQLAPGLFRCGDYVEDVSINGALLSGRRAAEAILAEQD